MTDDLVQRLRSNRPIPTLPHEAAERIEEMDRHLTMSGKVSKALSERIEVLEAEIEQWKVDYNELLLEASKLRAALKNHSYTGKGWRALKETYEALRDTDK